ncbi:MAG: S8 family serine peptidase [Deltaproteobacteria bacterium]|nr:S8 family serine peptidase [Deltaproteobacteria bacterium]
MSPNRRRSPGSTTAARLLLGLAGAALTLAACTPGERGTRPFVDSVPAYADLDSLQPGDYHPERFLVGLGTAPDKTIPLWRTALEPVREWPEIDVAVYEIPAAGDVLEVIRELRGRSDYDYVEPNLACHKLWRPDDTWYLEDQWNFQHIGMEIAWDTVTGDGAVVAVVDSGLDTAGSDTPVNVLAGINFADTTGSNPNWIDGDGHGTHVSGTVAQETNNAYAVAGIAFDASILPVRVLDDSGSGWQEDIIAGIIWAADNGADVINMSIGYDPYASGSQAEEVRSLRVGLPGRGRRLRLRLGCRCAAGGCVWQRWGDELGVSPSRLRLGHGGRCHRVRRLHHRLLEQGTGDGDRRARGRCWRLPARPQRYLSRRDPPGDLRLAEKEQAKELGFLLLRRH